MHLEELDIPLARLRGVGPASQKALGAAGIRTVRDLLWHLPRDWQDRSVRVPLVEARLAFGGGHDAAGTGETAGTWVCTQATVVGQEFFGHGAQKTLKVLIEDGSTVASLVCFGRAFLARQLTPGTRINVCGLAQYRFREIQLANFEFEVLHSDGVAQAAGAAAPSHSDFNRILPIYPLTGDLGQGFFRKTLAIALQGYGRHIDEFLPPALLERHRFMPRADAFGELHAPSSQAARTEAHRRLVYDELFLLQVQVAQRTIDRRRQAVSDKGAPEGSGNLANPQPAHARPAEAAAPDGPDLPDHWPPRLRQLAATLPFTLTTGQVASVNDILADLDKPWTLSRLIQGDVGSGKTLVALLGALAVIGRGAQAALMVPTVLLARQHAEKAAGLLAPLGINVALFAGNLSSGSRRALLAALASGDIQLVVGTHALFGADVAYRRLELAIIDEQHRFGVAQRLALHQKAHRPNLLMMSATPIPQTMALTVFGDMDVSSIRSLPAMRKPIETHLARMGNEQKVYEWVRKELQKGHQAYFVYPLIDETGEAEPAREGSAGMDSGETRELKNAEAMLRTLAGEIFPEWTVGMIHSKMPEESKESVMAQFAANQMQILVATSVVEVGVDVPNATCMVIEHTERFGLAALHQLRGRVGRGAAQSYCFLVYQEPLTDVAKRRLKILKESVDGFLIAEEDLAIRGPGDIKGIQQSGFMRLRIADLARDMAVMNQARADAFALLEADPDLTGPANAPLRRVLELLHKEEIAEETIREKSAAE